MTKTLRGNLIVGQSGGPTAVINNSLVGVIREALTHESIEGIYGSRWGIRGVLEEELIDLRRQSQETLEGLRYTPAAALGTVRYKLKEDDYERILKVFSTYNIRYFFYIGGNDSMDTAYKVHMLAKEQNYDLRVIGIPKTVDNDLAYTDHCPGYGSAARFVAMAIRDTGRDTEAMGASSPIKIMEIMGRNAGWLTAAAALAKEEEQDAPHLIYVPEHPISLDQIAEDVRRCYERYGRVVIALSEGTRDESGETIGSAYAPVEVDAFGHRMKGGAVEYLSAALRDKLGLKVRWDKPNYLQRSFEACVSEVDRNEAYLVGQQAVREALAGRSGQMITLLREPGPQYKVTTGLAPLDKVANAEKKLPAEYINESGNFVTEAFLDYARPLIGGPLPPYTRLKHIPVPKRS